MRDLAWWCAGGIKNYELFRRAAKQKQQPRVSKRHHCVLWMTFFSLLPDQDRISILLAHQLTKSHLKTTLFQWKF